MSFCLFAQRVSLCMLLQYVCSSLPLQCASQVHVNLLGSAYFVGVCASVRVRADRHGGGLH